MTRSPILAAVAALVLAAAANAQWSSDPDANFAIVDRAGEQQQCKVVVSGDGSIYVSWFDNGAGGGYDVYLQRLAPDGTRQWDDGGVLVADRSFSSTQDYGLAVDTAGNALLAFRDDRFGPVRITAAKVLPDGTLAWGENGAALTTGGGFVAAPKIAGTSDGAAAVAWTSDADTRVQKLDASGSPIWLNDVVLSDAGSANFSAADLQPADAGGAIVSWVRAQGFAGPKHIYAQKLDANGALLWGAGHVIVFDGGSLQFGNFPPFISDGAGGGVFAWYETSPLQCRVQHVLADGTEKFAHNGEVVSTNATRIRVAPSAVYDGVTDEITVFWREQSASQAMDGIYGQRFAPGGTRLWSNDGLVVEPVGDPERTQVRTVAMPGGGAAVYFVEAIAFGDDRLRGARVDADGTFAWDPALVDVSTFSSDKSRLAAASSGDMSILAWIDDRDDAGNVYGQNVNGDGTLGVADAPCPADVNGDGTVDGADLGLLLGGWGGEDPALDLNEDGTVDGADLGLLLGAWGPC